MGVFQDPGAHSFGFNGVYLVALVSNYEDEPLKPLYLKHHGKVYDLGGWNASSSFKIGYRPRRGRFPSGDRLIILHSINELTGKNIKSIVGLQYDAKSWAKYVSMSDTTDQVLKELERIGLRPSPHERGFTAEDVIMVIEWLKVRHASSVFHKRRSHYISTESTSFICDDRVAVDVGRPSSTIGV